MKWIIIHVVFALCAINCDIINKSVRRSVRIFGGRHVKEQIIVVMRNGGPETVDRFAYLLDPNVDNFSVRFTEGNRTLNYIQTTEVPPHRLLVNLQFGINPNDVRKVTVDLLHFGKVSPVRSALMGSDQYVIYRGNLYFYSNYETGSLTSSFFGKYNKIAPPPLRQFEDRVEYVFENVKPLNYTTLTVCYVENTPLLTISSLKRVIEVSHYGNIHITDRVSVKNEGRFAAPFPHDKVQTRNWWFTRLPFCATNIRYFDDLGNSSKSVLLHFDGYKLLMFKPRYPLLNGWKTTYTVEYGVPAFHYLLHHDRNRYSLQMKAVDHIFDDVIVEEAIVVVVLPYGTSDINVTLPDRFQKSDEAVSKFGRLAVQFVGKNIFECLEDFDIRYSWSKYYLFKTPLLIILYLECIFLAIIVVVHGKFVI